MSKNPRRVKKANVQVTLGPKEPGGLGLSPYALHDYNPVTRRSFEFSCGGTAMVEPSGIVSQNSFISHPSHFCDELLEHTFEQFLAGQASGRSLLRDTSAARAIELHLESERAPGRSTWLSLVLRREFDARPMGTTNWEIEGKRLSVPGKANGPSHLSDMHEGHGLGWTELPPRGDGCEVEHRVDFLVDPGTHTLTGELRFAWLRRMQTTPFSHSFSIERHENVIVRCTLRQLEAGQFEARVT